MADICRVYVYVKDMSGFILFIRVRREYFSRPPPASLWSAVSGFTHPDYLFLPPREAAIAGSRRCIQSRMGFLAAGAHAAALRCQMRGFLRAIRENSLTILA